MNSPLPIKIIRELDRRAIEEAGIPGIVLMENAGRKAAEFFHLHLKDSPVLLLCGKGNNGGDGFVIARHLHNWGRTIHIALAAEEHSIKRSPDAWTNFLIAKTMNLPMTQLLQNDIFDANALHGLLSKGGTVIDALLGSGIRGTVTSPYLEILTDVSASSLAIFAVDIPSGLNADTGEVLGVALRAQRTATFAASKLGFRQATEFIGEVEVIDIGIPKEYYEATDKTGTVSSTDEHR